MWHIECILYIYIYIYNTVYNIYIYFRMWDHLHSSPHRSLSYLTVGFLFLSLIACNNFLHGVGADDSKHPKSPDSSSNDDVKRKAREILGGSDKQEAALMSAIKPDEKGPLPFLVGVNFGDNLCHLCVEFKITWSLKHVTVMP